MKKYTVLLDAGGVILDEKEHEQVRADVSVEILSKIVKGYSRKQYWKDMEEAVKLFCPRAYEYVFFKYLKEDLRKFEYYYSQHIKKFKERKPALKLFQGLDKELKEISKEFDIGIAGQYGKEIITLLEEENLIQYFAFRLTQADFKITKPDPRYLEQITRAFKVDPEMCIMVGDRIDKDIIPAKQLHMKTALNRVGIHKNQMPRIPSEIPDIEIHGIKGLAKAIKTIIQ